MSLIYRNPSNMFALRDAMNHLFDESFSRHGGTTDGGAAYLPIDVYSTENEFVVTAAVPGLSPEDVSITMEAETVTISGEMPPHLENVDYLFSERFHGSFSRTLQLNVPIDSDKVEASFENGILTLVLPKAEALKPRKIEIKASK
ncbi:MAG: Hsp20/alpha crystallin family protein [Anaerolineae bacterium]|nr:Hsp20/alpha crystallin family protein [Anaerolineae bacterium]